MTDRTTEADLTARLQRVLGRLSRLLRRDAPAAIGPGTMSVLSTLLREGPLRPTELAAHEGVRPPTLTRMLTILEDGGYAVRTVDPADRRASRIAITDLGSETVLGNRSARASQLARHLAQLDPHQRDVLASALPVLEVLAGMDPLDASPEGQPPGAD